MPWKQGNTVSQKKKSCFRKHIIADYINYKMFWVNMTQLNLVLYLFWAKIL